MKSKTLIVYESQILFEILDEIKEYLNLEIINSSEKDFKNINFENFDNYVIVSTKEHKNIENYLLIDGSPKKILNILEKINVGLLKNKYLDQSEIKIGKYKLDINSRKISFKDTVLNLTEKETELIIYINQKKNVNLKELQNNVWQYSSDLETHTVETHIYRLRKKMKETFGDENFISNDTNGYLLN